MGKCKKMGIEMIGFMGKCNNANGFVHCIYRNTGEYGQIA
jgi:hypothetical protein